MNLKTITISLLCNTKDFFFYLGLFSFLKPEVHNREK